MAGEVGVRRPASWVRGLPTFPLVPAAAEPPRGELLAAEVASALALPVLAHSSAVAGVVVEV